MPDVSRTDSQRSDTSLRPRVSFNRDVHVKRIVPREGGRPVGALSSDGEGHLLSSHVRKQRVPRSKRLLQKEAAKVLHQVDRIDCISTQNGGAPEKFYTLPARRLRKSHADFSHASLDRQVHRRNSDDLVTGPKKPPRTFVTTPPLPTKKSSLRRATEDDAGKQIAGDQVSSLKKKQKNKKQLSPIIEVTPREDYFTAPPLSVSFKENDRNVGNECNPPIRNNVVIIDVDKATNISSGNSGKLLSAATIGRKLKSLTSGRKKKAKERAESIEDSKMIHSSQQPVEKLPLTRGRTVDTMVKKLTYDGTSPPPPKTSILITPNMSVQHNNNQPFSYTRGVSPDRSPASPTSPIIYAQVVCGSNGSGGKQTIHTAYTNGKKHLPHSDSDEGLGYEENSGFRPDKTAGNIGTGGGGGNTQFKNTGDYYHGTDDRFEEEYPIMPKFQTNAFNGFHYENKFTSKLEQGIFIDSSSRGRGDGMDAKRRESLTETTLEQSKLGNGRKDLSARRDLLESRITRRFGDKPKTNASGNVYTPPPKKYLGEESRDYRYNGFDSEPKSFDSQVSDYRSSPEQHGRHFETSHRSKVVYMGKSDKRALSKDRNIYKSNPEIHLRAAYNYDDHRRFQEATMAGSATNTYHGSLKRDAHDGERGGKDKFGDSGIENDFRRGDSGERRKRGEQLSNESEDEGFASSLLIASERQHTEDNFARKNRRGYDSDRGYVREDDSYAMEYRNNGYKSKQEFIPRERSIDDGSHFDPRIDKVDRSSLKKVVDRKPPKPEKKSSLEKMKQLFTGGKKKKEKEKAMVREESLRARYTEYRGDYEPKTFRKESNGNAAYDYNGHARRLSSPSPSPTRDLRKTHQPTHGSWFKSLDRLSRKKSKKVDKDGGERTEEEIPKPTKSLRFFGDTDQESSDSTAPHKSALKSRSALGHRSQSTRDLHNISEEAHHTHKSMLNLHHVAGGDVKGSRVSLKPPVSPSHRAHDQNKMMREQRNRRRKNEVSSVESSTEGDSSQQSQRSVVYLHAATVGDIPGPGYLSNGRRAASREELTSNGSSRIQPHVKTLSRSFSVLAPWKPRHYRENMDIDYAQYPKPSGAVKSSGKYEQYRNGSSRRDSSTLLKKKQAAESRRTNQNHLVSTLGNKRSRSKENVSTLKRGEPKSTSSSLYKKKERQSHKENNRYNRDEKRMAAKSMSVESLGSNRGSNGGRKPEVSRSISMPRDPEKSAGWFSMTKKNKNKSLSTHRL